MHVDYPAPAAVSRWRPTPARLVQQARAEGLDLVYDLIVNKEQRVPDIAAFLPGADPASSGGVLLLHGEVQGMLPDATADRAALEIKREELGEAHWDYIALGHLHRYQAPQINAVYPGSLERLDFGDTDGEKALLEVDLAIGPSDRHGGGVHLTRSPWGGWSVTAG